MKVTHKKIEPSQILLSLSEFLKFYNKNIPATFPPASEALLKKYKDAHTSFFKHGDMWSLDEHRKKIMDWLPLNSGSAIKAPRR